VLTSDEMAAAVKVLAFAGARDICGAAELEIEVEAGSPGTVAEVMEAICARFPALQQYRPLIRVAVNGAYADADTKVSGGDEVALIPPVAGG